LRFSEFAFSPGKFRTFVTICSWLHGRNLYLSLNDCILKKVSQKQVFSACKKAFSAFLMFAEKCSTLQACVVLTKKVEIRKRSH